MAGRREREDTVECLLGRVPSRRPRSRWAQRQASQRWVEEADATMRQLAKARAAVRASSVPLTDRP
jgi:hypothetical protein